jgi:hypothetical protein
MRLLLTTTLLMAPALPALAQDEMPTLRADQYGEIFCLARLGNDMGPVTGILTPGLTAAIAEAEAKDTEWAAANPGEKPPLGDGIPWQSWPDYAPKCEVGNVTLNTDDTAAVEIRYEFPDTPHAEYNDTLLLKLVDTEGYGLRHWRIDNIRYEDGTDLVASLIAAFEDETK